MNDKPIRGGFAGSVCAIQTEYDQVGRCCFRYSRRRVEALSHEYRVTQNNILGWTNSEGARSTLREELVFHRLREGLVAVGTAESPTAPRWHASLTPFRNVPHP